MTDSSAVVVQCFIKLDTVRAVLDALSKCQGADTIDVIIWRDGIEGNRKQAELQRHWDAVAAYLETFITSRQYPFRSVEVHENNCNLGPYATCRNSIDYACESHDFVIFTEDDVIFSRDALQWFFEVRSSGVFEQERIWAVSAESIFFDARHQTVDKEFVRKALAAATEQHLVNKYMLINYIPSSCFATSRGRWAQFRETRGTTNGDSLLARRCAEENRFCVAPVVARGKDIGMLHDLGYSVRIRTKEKVLAANKQNYLMAEDLLPAGVISRLRLEPFDGDEHLLFGQSTALRGFDVQRNSPSSNA